jgi:hypothetical protein
MTRLFSEPVMAFGAVDGIDYVKGASFFRTAFVSRCLLSRSNLFWTNNLTINDANAEFE